MITQAESVYTDGASLDDVLTGAKRAQYEAERERYEAAWAALGVKAPPRGIDLPYSDGEPMESWIHWLQMTLLILSLKNAWRDRHDFFAGGNMFLYYNAEQDRTRDVRGPDVFVAVDVPDHPRHSWVVWEENKAPDLIIEINSPRTRHIDHGIKKRIYQDNVRAPMYVIYDMERDELEGYILVGGVYQAMPLDHDGRLACDVLGLYLARWDGVFASANRRWLRWVTAEGTMLTTGDEDAEIERQHVQEERERADAEQQRAEVAQRQAEAEHQRAEVAQQQAEQERQRAEAARAEIARQAAALEAARRRIRELEARLGGQDER